MRSSAIVCGRTRLAKATNDYLMGRIRLASPAGELRDDDFRVLNGCLAR